MPKKNFIKKYSLKGGANPGSPVTNDKFDEKIKEVNDTLADIKTAAKDKFTDTERQQINNEVQKIKNILSELSYVKTKVEKLSTKDDMKDINEMLTIKVAKKVVKLKTYL